MKYCPDTSKEEAKKLLDEYGKKKKTKPTSMSELLKPLEDSTPVKNVTDTPKNSEISAVLPSVLGGYKFVCRIDSGADTAVISETIISFSVKKE